MDLTSKDSLKFVGILMIINALMHFFAFVVAGFNSDTYQFMVVGVIYALIAWGLLRGINWVAYIMFIFALFGSIAAFLAAGNSPIPSGWLYAILLLDIVVAVRLFGYLWSKA